MGAERYEVVIVGAKTGRQTKREWQASELLKCVPWLKRMNAQGSDINLRPLHRPEMLLVDALNADAVNDLHRQGFLPAVTVETSPGRSQAWMKLSDHPLSEELRKHAVLRLTRVLPKFGSHGRLAGFTNQQVEPNQQADIHLCLCMMQLEGWRRLQRHTSPPSSSTFKIWPLSSNV